METANLSNQLAALRTYGAGLHGLGRADRRRRNPRAVVRRPAPRQCAARPASDAAKHELRFVIVTLHERQAAPMDEIASTLVRLGGVSGLSLGHARN